MSQLVFRLSISFEIRFQGLKIPKTLPYSLHNFHHLIYLRTEVQAIPLQHLPKCTLAYRRGYNYMLKLYIDLNSLRHLVPDYQDFSRNPHRITTVLKPTRSGQVIPFRAPLAVDFHHFAYDRNNSRITAVSVSVSPNI